MLGILIGALVLVYSTATLVGVMGVIISAVFSGVTSLFNGVSSGEGLAIGILIGLVLFFCIRRRRESKAARNAEE